MRKTALFIHDLFLEHQPGYGHPESPERLRGLFEKLQAPEIRDAYLFPDFSPAPHEIIALNHTAAHIKRVAATAGKPFETLDPDTHTSPHSYEAARLAVGATVRGVEMVVQGDIDNGFALVRPPGHHAERDRTSGFCLFNNVAVAAQYALAKLGLSRVLIIDWDLHHGNGTQHSFYDTDRVLYFSPHQYPYFPGTGALLEVGSGAGEGYTVNVPLPGGQDDLAYARMFNELLAPIARSYEPELILVSAGFDTCLGDPLGSMGVSRRGYGYFTRFLVELAAELCNNRLLLVLEGGYHIAGLQDGVFACMAELAGRGEAKETYADLRKSAVALRCLEQARNVAKNYWTL